MISNQHLISKMNLTYDMHILSKNYNEYESYSTHQIQLNCSDMNAISLKTQDNTNVIENNYSKYITALLDKYFNSVNFDDTNDEFSSIQMMQYNKEDLSLYRNIENSDKSERKSNTSILSINSNCMNEKSGSDYQESILDDISENQLDIIEKSEQQFQSSSIPKYQYFMINPYNTTKSRHLSLPTNKLKEKTVFKDLDLDLFSSSFIKMLSNIDDNNLSNPNIVYDLITKIYETKDDLLSLDKKKQSSEPFEIIYSIKIQSKILKSLLNNIIENNQIDKNSHNNTIEEDFILYINKILIRLNENSSTCNLFRLDEKELIELYDKIYKLSKFKQYSEKMKICLGELKLFLYNNLKLFQNYNRYKFSESICYQNYNPKQYTTSSTTNINGNQYFSNIRNDFNIPKYETIFNGNENYFINQNPSEKLRNNKINNNIHSNNTTCFSTGNLSYLEDIANDKISLDFITVNKLFENLTKITPNEFHKKQNDLEYYSIMQNECIIDNITNGSTSKVLIRQHSANSPSYKNKPHHFENMSMENNFTSIVIFTYDEYTNAITLLMYLIVKYNVPKPFGMSIAESIKFEKCVVKLMKLKILSIMKFWICERQEDFILNDSLLNLLVGFLDRNILYEKDKHINQVCKYLSEKCTEIKLTKNCKSCEGNKYREYRRSPRMIFNIGKYTNTKSFVDEVIDFNVRSLHKSNTYSSPKNTTFDQFFQNKSLSPDASSPSMKYLFSNPMNSMNLSLIEDEMILNNDIEVAKQLTLLEFQLFSKITIHELLRLKHDKTKENDLVNVSQTIISKYTCTKSYDSDANTDNIPIMTLTNQQQQPYYTNYKKFIIRTNLTMQWVEFMILKQNDIPKRLEYIRKFLNIAEFCKSIHNYNTCHTIIAALSKLKQYIKWTFKLENQFQELQKSFGLNGKLTYYTTLFHNIKLPCLPLLWIYSSVFQRYRESKIYKNIKGYSKKYIMFNTIKSISDLCKDFKKLQDYQYNFNKNYQICDVLKYHYYENLEQKVYNMKMDMKLKQKS